MIVQVGGVIDSGGQIRDARARDVDHLLGDVQAVGLNVATCLGPQLLQEEAGAQTDIEYAQPLGSGVVALVSANLLDRSSERIADDRLRVIVVVGSDHFIVV